MEDKKAENRNQQSLKQKNLCGKISQFTETINKIYKPLPRLRKKKRRDKLLGSEIEITTDHQTLKR